MINLVEEPTPAATKTCHEAAEPAKEDAEAQGQEGHERKQMIEIAFNPRLPLGDIQKLFDETAEGNMGRRQAIADCMGHSFSQANKESQQRIRDAENLVP